jgi:AAA ATPase domain
MSRLDQPYRPAPGADPPALAGRDGELSAARYAISLASQHETPQPIVFTGLRGVGKTALLRRTLLAAKEARGVVVSAEPSRWLRIGEELRRSVERARDEHARLTQRLGRAYAKVLRALPTASYELPGDLGAVSIAGRERRAQHANLMAALSSLNDELRREGRFLLIAIDELQEGSIAELTSLVTFVHETAGTDRPVLFLGAGLPTVPTHLHDVRTYTERWRFFPLGLLRPAETAQAIDRPASERGVQFESKALEALVKETAGYPYFIQEYAGAVWLRRTGNVVRKADVDAVVPGVRRTLEASLYDQRFARLTPREAAVVLALAQLGEGEQTIGNVAAALGVTSDRLSSIRQALVRKDVVVSPNPGIIEFRIPLSSAYVIRHEDRFERRIGSRRDLSFLTTTRRRKAS